MKKILILVTTIMLAGCHVADDSALFVCGNQKPFFGVLAPGFDDSVWEIKQFDGNSSFGYVVAKIPANSCQRYYNIKAAEVANEWEQKHPGQIINVR